MDKRTLHCLGQILGAPASIDLRGPLSSAVFHRLLDQVLGWLRHVEELFSTERPHSQVNLLDQGLLRLNQTDSLVREVLSTCARINARTNGYFDVHTTGRLDPSQYVRCWAAQRASALLTDASASNHYMCVGENISASDWPSEDGTWRIHTWYQSRPGTTGWMLSATDVAVATSALHAPGDHTTDSPIRNPMTRRPASGLASMTVAGPDLGVACAYATAAIAMGPAARDWLPKLDGHAYAGIDDEGRSFHGGKLPGVLLMPICSLTGKSKV